MEPFATPENLPSAMAYLNNAMAELGLQCSIELEGTQTVRARHANTLPIPMWHLKMAIGQQARGMNFSSSPGRASQ